jgi:hypothetical protein
MSGWIQAAMQQNTIIALKKLIRFWTQYSKQEYLNHFKVQLLWEGLKIWKKIFNFFWNFLVTSKESERYFQIILRISEIYEQPFRS